MSEVLNLIDVNDYGLQSMVGGGGSAEDLTEVLNTQDTLLENQETKIEQMVQALQNKKSIDLATETADATATPDDIVPNKTAYVNGQKITGAISTVVKSGETNSLGGTVRLYNSGNGIRQYCVWTKGALFKEGSYVGFSCSDVATAINLQPSQIKKDEVVLGVTGTYEGGSSKVILPDKIKFTNSRCTEMNWLKNADVSNFTEMDSMFSNCLYLTSLDLEGFITSNVKSISNMFYNCINLVNINLNNCDTSNVTSLNDLFNGCEKLERVDLSSFTIKANRDSNYNLHRIFNGCTSLMYIDISGLDFSGNFNYHSNIFYNVPANCLIYVKDQNAVDKLTTWDNTHTYTIKP